MNPIDVLEKQNTVSEVTNFQNVKRGKANVQTEAADQYHHADSESSSKIDTKKIKLARS